MDPITMALIGSLISAGGSIAGGYLNKPKETKTQKGQRDITQELMAAIHGQGPLANLFSADQNAFQQSYVEPAKAMFQNQIAPQIQQSYIAGGQQRNSGLTDTLTRAGVDMDMLLNSQYAQFQNDAMGRQMQGLGLALGQGPGVSQQNPLGPATAGYLTGGGFETNMNSILDAFKNRNTSLSSPSQRAGVSSGQQFPRRGYA